MAAGWHWVMLGDTAWRSFLPFRKPSCFFSLGEAAYADHSSTLCH